LTISYIAITTVETITCAAWRNKR